jgi:hypothetical protein
MNLEFTTFESQFRTMPKTILFLSVFFITLQSYSQNWQAFTDSIPTLSSPRVSDLNGDNVLDVIIGGGTDGVYSNNGIMAYNGLDGSLLWKRAARNEVFGSAIFQDITGDAINDVFIVGRSAQLLAINGLNGQLIWDYFPYGTNPVDSGLYNFYNPQFIHDVDGDSYPDILVTNGGDHAAPAWETDRPTGRMMVISSLSGVLLAEALVPDGAETYCSPIVADIQNNGIQWILFGTGGENLGGHFYMAPLDELISSNTLENSITLASDSEKGFIAPASIYRKEDGSYDIFIHSFGGTFYKIKGQGGSLMWSYTKPSTESSAAPVIGNFTGDLTPDVALSLYKGIAPSYTDFYQIILDGSTGELKFMDSLGVIQYASGNAVDLNNDGRDEVLFSVTYVEDGYFKTRIESYDPVNNTLTTLDNAKTGVNLGSTPYVGDIDQDGLLDLIYSVKKDSIDPVGWKGIYVYHHELNSIVPNSGVAWGSYMGTAYDGEYLLVPVDCGFGSVISGITISNPSCNGFSDGMIVPGVIAGSDPYTYLWSTGSTEAVLQNVSAGTYWVQITNGQDCYEYRSVTLNDPFVITYGGIVPPTCIGDTNGMATLNSSGCYCMFSTCTFLWDNGITTKPNNQLHEGWNSVIITHSNGCVVEDSVFIPSPLPVIDSIEVYDVSACFGDATGSAIVFTNPGVQPITILWSTNEVNDSISNLTAGDYYVVVQDNRPCRDSIAFTITQPEELVFSASATNVSCNGISDGEITFNSTGGTVPYTYFVNSNSSAQSNVTDLGPGNYTIHVEDMNGCTTIPDNIVITEPTVLSAEVSVLSNASGLTSLDGMALCAVSGGTSPYTITWNDSNSQPGTTAVYLNPGWYTASVVDANGCLFEDSVYIGVLEVDELTQSQQLFYPNPSNGEIQFMGEFESVSIFDAKGSLVWKENAPLGKRYLDMANGVYMVELTSNEEVRNIRLILSR